MLAKVFVSAAIIATALAGALPAPALTPSAEYPAGGLAVCADRGIDASGPIPSDAVPIEGGYTFAADSDASYWAQAQIELAGSSDLQKREYANIGIGMFAQNGCGGQGSWFDNVQYDVSHISNVNLFSVGISYRGLRDNEHLDFSRWNGNDLCGAYLFSAGFLTNVGCFSTQAINCFKLWRN